MSDWDDLIRDLPFVVAAARSAAGQTGIRHYARYLAVTDDCYVPAAPGGAVERRRQYTVLNELGQPMSGAIKIQEQITVTNGELATGSYPGTWMGGTFIDNLSKIAGASSDVFELQQFTAVVTSGLDVYPINLGPSPLIIIENNGRQYGTLNVKMYNDSVDINGDNMAGISICRQ